MFRQIPEAVPDRHVHRRPSAQPVPGVHVAARRLRHAKLHLQLLRLLRHGVALPAHVVGTAGKEAEERNVQGNDHDQHKLTYRRTDRHTDRRHDLVYVNLFKVI